MENVGQMQRIEWIDILKGMGIVLMVWGHTSIPTPVNRWIFSFHMPLFFIASGFLFKGIANVSFHNFLSHKLRTFVIPYLFFLACWILYLYIKKESLQLNIFTRGDKVGAFWFLQVLFVVEIIHALVLKNVSQKIYILFILSVYVAGYILSLYHIHLPYRLECFGLGSIHFGMGVLLRNYAKKMNIRLLGAILLLILSIGLSIISPRLDINYNMHGNPIGNVFLAWIGVAAFVGLSKELEMLKGLKIVKYFLLWAGKNSIIIMGLSQVTMIALIDAMNALAVPGIISSGLRHILIWCLLFVFSLMLNKYTPFLIGKRTKK